MAFKRGGDGVAGVHQVHALGRSVDRGQGREENKTSTARTAQITARHVPPRPLLQDTKGR